jgi:hexokinase
VIQTVWDLMNVVEENLLNEVEVLAINFAYPIQPVLRQGRLDGKLLRPVKEHLFAGLVGKCVGQQIEEYFGGKGRHLKVTLANDMVCLLQAGREKVNDSRTLVAGVVGTGVNFAILDAEYGIVNLESAGFDKFKISWAGRAIDQVSKNVGQHLFEKEVSGKYLFEHYNLMKNVFQLEPIETSEQLNQIADETKHPGRNLARSILMRSAELLACQIAGLLDFLGQNKLTFVMEGSLFWKGWHYQGLIYSALKKMDISADRVEFVEIKQSNILGAGRLVKLI